ncbi:ABC transporter substrate-binding protein [Sphingobacterium sp. SGR-19]|uniref:ABC transporter substrate-binding protein n=1 Tax=Sphingobacterium sp. SGR-19 TaxID=2710886 RepID=UPI0013EC1426|nr:ABC transporter substrate-binding protein [Sphingobacterium sp. SGR-19]NGM66690.1 ABC transporter substrate-binding protein [Sphingobacterium sp. SGR-19]
MQNLNFYTTLLKNIQQTQPNLAEHLDEEINILIHKLKFIPEDQRPSVLILAQQTDFQPLFNERLVDSIAIAGGKLLTEKYDNPSLLFIVQENDRLYTEVPALLLDEILSRTDAIQSNNVYIIQKRNFGMESTDFLHDIEICAEIVQPKYFIFGRKGKDWVQFDIA